MTNAHHSLCNSNQSDTEKVVMSTRPKSAFLYFRRLSTALALSWAVLGPAPGVAAQYRTTEPSGWYNTDYIYAATRGLNDSSMHPGVKITLVPATLVLDTAFLPFALVMGCFGH